MNSVSNSIIKSLVGKNNNILLVQCVSWFMFLWLVGIFLIAWASFVLIQYHHDKEDTIKKLFLIAGCLNIFITTILLIYAIFLIKYKIAPGGMMGTYNMEMKYHSHHIGYNRWLLLLFVLNVASTALFFVAWSNYDKNNRDLGDTLSKFATSIITIIVVGWIAYNTYLGIACRSNELFHIVYELNKSSPNIMKMANDIESVIRRKGDNMNINLFDDFKQILLATE